MSVALPAHGAHHLNGQRGDAVGQDGESVLLGLGIEHLEARNRDDAGLDVVLLQELLGGIHGNGNFGTGRDQGDLGTLDLLQDVSTLDGLLDDGALELGQVLARQGNDAGGVLGGQGNVVGSAGLVAVSRAPHHAVGEGTEVSQSLDRLVSRTVLTQTDGVVGSDPDDSDAGQGRQTDGTGSVGDEVEESTTVGDDGSVGGQTVHDGTHTVLTDTISDVSSGVVAEAGGRGLEVDGLLPAGKVGASQIGRATLKLGEDGLDLAEDGLGQLSAGNGSVAGAVDGQALLPALGQLALQAASEVSVLGGVLLGVLSEQLVPLLLLGGTLRGVSAVELGDLLGDDEALLGVEAELGLELLDVVGLEGGAVDTVGALLEGAETNGGSQLDD